MAKTETAKEDGNLSQEKQASVKDFEAIGWKIFQDEKKLWQGEKQFDGIEGATVLEGFFSLDVLLAEIGNAESVLAFDEKGENEEKTEKLQELPKYSLESCRVELTTDDILQRNNSMLKAMTEKDQEIARFKSEADKHKHNLKKIEAEIQRNRVAMDTRHEWRDLQCSLEYDFQKGMVNVIRPDTFDVIKTRSMTKEELQRALPLEK